MSNFMYKFKEKMKFETQKSSTTIFCKHVCDDFSNVVYVLKLGRNIISLGWLDFLWFMNILQHSKLKKLGKLFWW